jgi:hypothetical protein
MKGMPSIMLVCSLLVRTQRCKKFAFGTNKSFTSHGEPSIHAEKDVLLKAFNNPKFGSRKKTLNMLIIRIDKFGNLGYSRPCEKCIKLLVNCGLKISHIYYSSHTGHIVKEHLMDMLESELTRKTVGYKRHLW